MDTVFREDPVLESGCGTGRPPVDIDHPLLLDASDEAALLAHVLRLARLIRFFEYGGEPSGDWAGVLLLDPLLAVAALGGDPALRDPRPARIAALAEELRSAGPAGGAGALLSRLDQLIEEESAWQTAWSEALEKAGVPCPLAPFAPPSAMNTRDRVPGTGGPWEEEAGWYAGAAVRLGERRISLTRHAGAKVTDFLKAPAGKLHPHAGLLAAFLRLRRHVRESLNRLPLRYADHFYENVLGFRPASLRPDRVLVCFATEEDSPAMMLPAGTQVLTGPEPPLAFLTEADTPVSADTLEAVLALCPESPPGPWCRETARPGFPAGAAPWRPFSEPGGLRICPTLLALPFLRLAGGTRQVEADFALRPDMETASADALRRAWEAIPAGEPLLSVELSGREGWFAPSALEVDMAFGQNGSGEAEHAGSDPALVELRLRFTLEAGQSGLCPPAQDTHGLTADEPALRLTPLVIPRVFWAELAAWRADSVRLKADVRGLAGFHLCVNGEQSPNTPDAAVECFGNPPGPGSSFGVEVPELEGKKVGSLRLRWDWSAPEWFSRYFKAYDFSPILLTPWFRLAPAGGWKQAGGTVELSGGGTRVLDFPIAEAEGPRWFRWTLGSGNLFGHTAYPALLARATLNESTLFRRALAGLRHDVRLKNLRPPFTPVWKDLRIDYTAGAVHDLQQESLRPEHLHPWPGLYPRRSNRLFAHYPEHSLALRWTRTGDTAQDSPLSVCFRIQNTQERARNLPMTVYGGSLTGDETAGLQRTGLVRLLRRGTGPEEAAWLRFAWDSPPEVVLHGIFAHAARAVFDPGSVPGDPDSLERPFPLPSGSLTRLGTPGPGGRLAPEILKKVRVGQPFPSFGGHAGGKTLAGRKAFRRTCAERLGHRGQAVLARDYERLTLREFPEVLAARCLAHSDGSSGSPKPGCVVVAVFAPQEGAKRDCGAEGEGSFVLDPSVPIRAEAGLTDRIEAFLRGRCSPYVSVGVADPHWRGVRLRLSAVRDPRKPASEAEEEARRVLASWIAPWALPPHVVAFGRDPDPGEVLDGLRDLNWLLRIESLELTGPDGESRVLAKGDRENRESVRAVCGSLDLLYARKLEIVLATPGGSR